MLNLFFGRGASPWSSYKGSALDPLGALSGPKTPHRYIFFRLFANFFLLLKLFLKTLELPAPKYISLLMDWVESQINDENIFPVKVGE